MSIQCMMAGQTKITQGPDVARGLLTPDIQELGKWALEINIAQGKGTKNISPKWMNSQFNYIHVLTHVHYE